MEVYEQSELAGVGEGVCPCWIASEPLTQLQLVR
jgi:hypothetical protein